MVVLDHHAAHVAHTARAGLEQQVTRFEVSGCTRARSVLSMFRMVFATFVKSQFGVQLAGQHSTSEVAVNAIRSTLKGPLVESVQCVAAVCLRSPGCQQFTTQFSSHDVSTGRGPRQVALKSMRLVCMIGQRAGCLIGNERGKMQPLAASATPQLAHGKQRSVYFIDLTLPLAALTCTQQATFSVFY